MCGRISERLSSQPVEEQAGSWATVGNHLATTPQLSTHLSGTMIRVRTHAGVAATVGSASGAGPEPPPAFSLAASRAVDA